MRIKYRVGLTKEEREQLLGLIRKGKHGARTLARARILLKADEGRLTDEGIAEALNVGYATVGRVRQRFVEEGMERALQEAPRPGAKPKLDERQCAHVIAVACSEAPEGHDHWTLRLLADKVVELGFAESYSHEAVRQTLKKTTSSHGKGKCGASPRSAPSM
jgi:transposase